MKRFLVLILTALMLVTAAAPALAARPEVKYPVTFNGHPIMFDVEPVNVNDRVFVPFRAIFEKMGADVQWDPSTRTVTATRGDVTIQLVIGSTTARVNGQARTLDAAPFIQDNRTMVPLRFVSEAFGAQVEYDNATTAIRIVDPNWPRRGGTLNLALWNKPAHTFNPIIVNEVYADAIVSKVWDGLWRYDERVIPIPALAEHWEWDDTNTVLTFYLRRDVRFHDGTPFTAKDVIFTYKAIWHPRYLGPRNTGWEDVLGWEEYTKGLKGETPENFANGYVTPTPIEGLYAPDDYTVVFKLKKPNAVFLENLAYGILDHTKYLNVPVQDFATARDPNFTKLNGTGPFKLESFVEGQHYILTANKDYFLGAPYIDRIIYRVLDSNVAVGEMQRGTLDMVEFNATEYDAYKNLSNINIVEYPAMQYQYMGFNTVEGPTSDKRVRQAIAYAINRDVIIQNIMGNHASALYTPIHPLTWAYTDDVEQYNFNPAKARELLDQAGWTVGPDGVRVKDGQRLRLRLVYPNEGNQARIRTAPVVQQMLKEVGIEVELVGYDFTTVSTKVFEEYDFDLYFIGMSLSIDPDPSDIFGREAAETPGSFNGVRWWTPYSEELLAKAKQTTDIAERAELYYEWQKHFAEEMPAYFFYAPTALRATSKRLQNYRPGVQGDWWNIEEIWLSE